MVNNQLQLHAPLLACYVSHVNNNNNNNNDKIEQCHAVYEL